MVGEFCRLNEHRCDVAKAPAHLHIHLPGADFGEDPPQSPVKLACCPWRQKNKGLTLGFLLAFSNPQTSGRKMDAASGSRVSQTQTQNRVANVIVRRGQSGLGELGAR